MAVRRAPESEPATSVNEVRLRGRLAGVQEERELPSGDRVVTFRVVVDRESGSGGSARVDTLDCAAFRSDARRKVSGWEPGDQIEVTGALRRRFFRVGGGPASRYEVEVRTAARVSRVAR